MKITNTLLIVAMAGSLAACEKSNADTANPGDAAPETPSTDMEAPAADDSMDDLGGDMAEEPAADDMGGDEAEGDEAEGDEAAEGEE